VIKGEERIKERKDKGMDYINTAKVILSGI